MSRYHPALQAAWDVGGRICDWPPGYLDILAALVASEPALPYAIRRAQAQVGKQRPKAGVS